MANYNSINNKSYVFNSDTTITAGTGITCTLNAITATAGDLVATAGNLSIGRIAADATNPLAAFKKSRSAGVITSGDGLGEVDFTGHDGTQYIVGSKITSTNSGTVATNRIASDLKFYTHRDTTDAAKLRLTINPDGAFTIAAPDSGTALTITDGGLTVTSGSTTLTPLAAGTAGVVTKSTTGVLGAIENTANDGYLLISKADASNPIWAGLTAGAGISVTPGANSITITNTSLSGLVWAEATADLAPMVVGYGYVANKAGTMLSAALPATAALGDTIEIVGKGATLWTITQGANQFINFGSTTTTVGTGGSITATNQNDAIALVCTTAGASTGWTIKHAVGNLTIA